VQDRMSKREALQIMLKRRAVLVASHSFWEGVDLPGQALNLVVIDKLPFASPDDPVLQARFAQAKQDGGSGFKDVSLPQAAQLLKQGAGRLIRSTTDRGVLAVFDNRLQASSYGAVLRAALPPFSVVATLEEACAFLEQL
jgi:ATP-dependent DNA helicase DinG